MIRSRMTQFQCGWAPGPLILVPECLHWCGWACFDPGDFELFVETISQWIPVTSTGGNPSIQVSFGFYRSLGLGLRCCHHRCLPCLTYATNLDPKIGGAFLADKAYAQGKNTIAAPFHPCPVSCKPTSKLQVLEGESSDPCYLCRWLPLGSPMLSTETPDGSASQQVFFGGLIGLLERIAEKPPVA